MVHGRLPGLSRLSWPSVKAQGRGELETPLPLEPSFHGNWHFSRAASNSVAVILRLVQVNPRCGRAGLDWEWWWWWWEGRRNGQD